MEYGPLIRNEKVFKRKSVEGDWTYQQEWLCLNHPHSGTTCTFDMDGTAKFTPQEAMEHAYGEENYAARAGFELLNVWHCGLLH